MWTIKHTSTCLPIYEYIGFACVHTHTHAHTHTRTHARTHTHAHTHAHTHTHTHTHTRTAMYCVSKQSRKLNHPSLCKHHIRHCKMIHTYIHTHNTCLHSYACHVTYSYNTYSYNTLTYKCYHSKEIIISLTLTNTIPSA